jgi:hypothetical protein
MLICDLADEVRVLQSVRAPLRAVGIRGAVFVAVRLERLQPAVVLLTPDDRPRAEIVADAIERFDRDFPRRQYCPTLHRTHT